MTEQEAREWITARYDDAAVRRLEDFVAIVRDESARQNLVSRPTLEQIWARHIVDSLQLIDLANEAGDWLDIGTGAGFPGLAVACVQPLRRLILVEPRRLRADYLRSSAETLGLDNVEVVTAKVQNVAYQAAVISARAVAMVSDVLSAAIHCAGPRTVFILPKGRSAAEEVAHARQKWHGVFHVEHSITSPDSAIVIARKVRAR